MFPGIIASFLGLCGCASVSAGCMYAHSSSETEITDLNLIDTPWAFRLHEKK
jgi:hypothetical protein